MAYVNDKEFIFNKMHSNKLAYYKVVDSDGKSVLDIQDDDEVTVDEAVTRLRDTLENLTGLITVVLSDRSSRSKAAGGNVSNIKISIKLGESGVKGIGGHSEVANDAVRSAIVREYEAKMETMMEKHRNELAILRMNHDNEKKFNELKEQIKELKDGDVLEKMAPYLAGIFGMPAQQAEGVATALAGPEDPKERLAAAINRIIKVDRNFLAHLELLADLAESKPMIYSMAIEKLKSL